jgi:hypothetical protein
MRRDNRAVLLLKSREVKFVSMHSRYWREEHPLKSRKDRGA